MSLNRKLDVQRIAETILQKHGINPASTRYYLKLQNVQYADLVIEKAGGQVLIGHYTKQNGNLISDPVLALDDDHGFWYPVRIEQRCCDTICSFVQQGKRVLYAERMREFMNFQRMFARNIKAQGWLNAECKRIRA
jgi:hypothetical protein